MKWIILLGFIAFFNQSFGVSNCTPPAFANLTVEPNFNLNKFLGGWYEIQWLQGEPHNLSDIWSNYHASFELDGSSTQKLTVPIRARLLNDQTCFSSGPWSMIANNSAKLILVKRDPTSNISLNWPYYVLKTDHITYALTYVCESENYVLTNPCLERILWLFSRTPTLSNDTIASLDSYIENQLCINLTNLDNTPQDGLSCYTSSSNINIFSVFFFIFLFFLYI